MLASTVIAGIVLDGQLRVRRVAPVAAAPFRVSEADVGRHLGELAPGFDDPHLLGDAQAVLAQAAPLEREVQIVGVNRTGDPAWSAPPGQPAGLSGDALMVQDSALVAAEMAGLVEELGCHVPGPAASPDEAKRFMAEH